jgi:DNA-binding CsgD family transcriptional regulator
MEGLSERDVDLALAFVSAAASTQNGAPFGIEAVDVLLEAIPADTAAYVEWQFGETDALQIRRPENDPWRDTEALGELIEATCASYPLVDVELSRSVEPIRITDVVTSTAFRATSCYALMMRPYGLEHEVKLWLPAPPGHARFFELTRGRGPNFSARDVALLRLVRPHLARLRTRWERMPCAPQLTEREREVLGLVAQGLTNREVARRLFVSSATVRTHLEHAYEKLGVRTRAAAVAAAFRVA